MLIGTALVGLAALLFGRQLYWLFVGAAGFLVGVVLAPALFAGHPPWLTTLIALAVGALGALLAIVAKMVAIGLAGFVAGAYVALLLLGSPAPGSLSGGAALLVLAAGVVGTVLVIALLDPALILLSSGTGAALLSRVADQTLAPGPLLGAVIFLLLLATGIAVQGARWARDRRSGRQAPAS